MARSGRPVVISFAADVASFLRGSKKVEKSTEDIADELQKAERSSEDFSREFRRSMDKAERAADSSSRKIGRDFERAGDDIADIGKEAGEEFQQNLGESIAQGDLSGIVQDTLGGLTAALKGPVGLAAAAVAGVIGFAFATFREKSEEEAAEIKAIWEGVASSIESLYTQGILTATRTEIYQATVDALKEMTPLIDKARDGFAKWGVDANDVAAAAVLGGDAWAEQEQILYNILNNVEATSGIYSEDYRQIADLVVQAQGWHDESAGVRTEQEGIAAAADATARALGLVDTNGDGIIDDTDKIAGNTATAADNMGTVANESERAADALGRSREEIQKLVRERATKWIEFRATGNAAAYVTQGGSNYSPAYVAIDNYYQRNPNG